MATMPDHKLIADIIIKIGRLISSFMPGYFLIKSSDGFGSDISLILKFERITVLIIVSNVL